MQTLQSLLQKADFYKEKLSSIPALAKEEQKSLDHYFRINFTYHNNGLDGNFFTIPEIKLLLETGITVGGRLLKDCYETVGHADAYNFMLKVARQQNLNLSEEIIKKLHQLFYQRIDIEQAGMYRMIQVYIPETQYVPPLPEEIPQFMKHLADQIHSSHTTLHPIELAAMAHKRLIDIHPFIDGNGNTARLLMNLILVNAGYAITSIPLMKQNDYINALSIARKQSDMDTFTRFIAICVIEAQKDYCRLLKA